MPNVRFLVISGEDLMNHLFIYHLPYSPLYQSILVLQRKTALAASSALGDCSLTRIGSLDLLG